MTTWHKKRRLRLLGAVLLGTAALAACPAVAQTADATGRLVYSAAFYTTYAPSNALQIVQRTPGFRLDTGDTEVRGLSQAAGNVVINGERPSSKSDTLDTILARIPASRVARIEVGAGSLFGAEYSQVSQVLNVVLTTTTGLSGTFEGAVRREFTGKFLPQGSASVLLKRGKSTFNASVGVKNDNTSEEGIDRFFTLPGSVQTEFRRKVNHIQEPVTSGSLSWAYDDGPNRSAHLNGRIDRDPFELIQENAVLPTGGALRNDSLTQHFGVTGFELGGDIMRPFAGGGLKLIVLATRKHRINALSARMTELERSFPKDITWALSYDTTPFIQASIDNVIQTLVEAMLLVFLVMFLFLQSWRATVIPALVVPIALLGGCLGLWAFGFSINQLSLFAMVVAIGILVDDAIVVVENVERIMAEEGLSPARATIKAMGQIRGAIIGITAVLIAVFLPMAFFPGSTGGIYRQFSVTLAVSIFFSALLALTLTPALCATLLKPHTHKPGHTPEPRSGWRGWPQRFFNGFNDRFTRSTDRYAGGVAAMLSRPLRWLAVFVAVVGVTWLLFARLPGGFLPEEDQGYFVINYDAPPAATMAQTEAAVKAVETEFAKLPQSQEIFSVIGFNFFGQGQTAGLSWAMLKPFDERKGKDLSVDSAIGAVFGAAANVPGANIFAINPPAIDSLGNATGFTMKIEDRGGNDPAGLQAALGAILGAASQNPKLAGVRPEGQPPSPQLYVDIDRVQARALGLSIADVNATLSIAFGSAYANDFSNEGNVQRVYLQADAPQRMTEDDVLNLRVRGSSGQMVPFSAFTKVHWMQGATQLQRYNGYPSLTISGQAAPGESSGTALKEMEKIADQILKGSQSYEWTGTAFEEKQAGGQIGLLLGLSLIVVFLLLVGLYNSWAIPLSVLLVVPFGVLGAVLFTMLRGLSADVYFNIGLITIIGLAAKNAILVVEFAIEDEVGDRTPLQATLEAARQRLRPILMTSLAFILGMVPLVIAGGAGSASRHAVGTGVMGGMIAATAFGIFFTPLFYFAARKWLSRASVHHASDAEEPKPLPPTATPDEGGTAHA